MSKGSAGSWWRSAGRCHRSCLPVPRPARSGGAGGLGSGRGRCGSPAVHVIYALATVLFLPGAALTLVGGALFGPVAGTLYNLTGATIVPSSRSSRRATSRPTGSGSAPGRASTAS